jgi:hypothetical protein
MRLENYSSILSICADKSAIRRIRPAIGVNTDITSRIGQGGGGGGYAIQSCSRLYDHVRLRFGLSKPCELKVRTVFIYLVSGAGIDTEGL